MRVVFLIQGRQVAASRYRVLQYLPFLEAGGIEPVVFEFPRSLGAWLSLYGQLRTADILFVQRKRLPLSALALLKGRGKRIIYDFDDAVMFKDSLSEKPFSLRRRMSFQRMLRFSDLVIAGNRFLKGEAQKYHGNVQVLPTPIDADRYRAKEYRETKTVNIGWIGSSSTIRYMESHKNVWEALGRKYPHVTLTIICDTFMETTMIPLRKVRWSYDTEIDDLHHLDIGVMPLFMDLWSEGKCGFKIIQYLGVGIPAVCTPVGINRDVVDDGANGFWAVKHEEWLEKLSRLIEDPDLRMKMGRAGREKIMQHYTVQKCAPLLTEWIKSLG